MWEQVLLRTCFALRNTVNAGWQATPAFTGCDGFVPPVAKTLGPWSQCLGERANAVVRVILDELSCLHDSGSLPAELRQVSLKRVNL